MLREERAQTWQLGGKGGIATTILLAHGQFHQLQMEILQVGNEVQRMVQMSLLLLALFAQEVAQLHIPEKYRLLLLGCSLALGNECRPNRLGTELQGSKKIFELPEIENIFGNIFATTTLSDIHTFLLFVVIAQRYKKAINISIKSRQNCGRKEKRESAPETVSTSKKRYHQTVVSSADFIIVGANLR